MLTPDQVRMLLDEAFLKQDRASALLYLLWDVLPDLVAAASGRSGADQARVYHPATCQRCSDEIPCLRAKQLAGDAGGVLDEASRG